MAETGLRIYRRNTTENGIKKQQQQIPKYLLLPYFAVTVSDFSTSFPKAYPLKSPVFPLEYKSKVSRNYIWKVWDMLHGIHIFGLWLCRGIHENYLSLLPLNGLLRSGDIFYIGGNDVLPAPLDPKREAFVLGKLGTDQKEEARSVLIEHNLRLVVYIAKKFDNTGVGVEDLISIGTIGLIKAINTFNPVKNIKLATYASRCIENEILMYLRRNSKTKMEVSIDEPLNVDWDGNELLLSDILGTDEDVISRRLEDEAEISLLTKAIGKLSDREQTIVRLRFGIGSRDSKEQTQKEVADLLGISQSYISRLEKRIMKRLKKEIVKYE